MFRRRALKKIARADRRKWECSYHGEWSLLHSQSNPSNRRNGRQAARKKPRRKSFHAETPPRPARLPRRKTPAAKKADRGKKTASQLSPYSRNPPPSTWPHRETLPPMCPIPYLCYHLLSVCVCVFLTHSRYLGSQNLFPIARITLGFNPCRQYWEELDSSRPQSKNPEAIPNQKRLQKPTQFSMDFTINFNASFGMEQKNAASGSGSKSGNVCETTRGACLWPYSAANHSPQIVDLHLMNCHLVLETGKWFFRLALLVADGGYKFLILVF